MTTKMPIASYATQRPKLTTSLAAPAGFTLIEVLIGLALSLIALVVVLQVFSVSNSRKSVIVGGAEAQQIASVASFQMGRVFRIGGSGFSNGRSVIGCRIVASKSASAILPAPAAFAAPFASVSSTVRVIPVLAYAGAGANGTDILVTIADNAETSTAEYDIDGVPGTASITLKNTNGIRVNDFLLATDPVDPITTNPADCTLARVSSAFAAYNYASSPRLATATVVPLAASNVYNISGALSTYPLSTRMLNLGQTPSFYIYGLDDKNRLLQKDLLQISGAADSVMAENIVDFRVLYGVDTDDNGVLDDWVTPTGVWSAAALSVGTAAATLKIKQILAMRTAIVVRSTEAAADAEPKANYVMFGDIAALKQTVSIATGQQKRRHQVLESIVSIRNLRLPQAVPTL